MKSIMRKVAKKTLITIALYSTVILVSPHIAMAQGNDAMNERDAIYEFIDSLLRKIPISRQTMTDLGFIITFEEKDEYKTSLFYDNKIINSELRIDNSELRESTKDRTKTFLTMDISSKCITRNDISKKYRIIHIGISGPQDDSGMVYLFDHDQYDIYFSFREKSGFCLSGVGIDFF
jgi:hypothetical protein